MILIFFSGCAANKNAVTPPIPNLNFSGDINVEFNKINIECKIENRIDSGCKLTVLKPELISGLVIFVRNSNCTFKIGDIEYEVNSSVLKDTEFAVSISEAFANVLTTTEYAKNNEGNWRYTGKTTVGNFVFVQDSTSGYPISLEIPNKKLYVTFSNMKSI